MARRAVRRHECVVCGQRIRRGEEVAVRLVARRRVDVVTLACGACAEAVRGVERKMAENALSARIRVRHDGGLYDVRSLW